MTDERDFDRLARAWLELGPDEAPDRVIAAVHHAVEATPQVRRPLRWPSWRFSQVTRLPLAAGAAAVLVVAIGGGYLLNQRNQPVIGGPGPSPTAAPSPSPSSAPSPSVVVSPPPSATPAVAIVLQRAPTNLGCDSIGIDYDMATIRIDPAAAVQVWAEANDGTKLATYWSAGFSTTNVKQPSILGPDGDVVATDGTSIDIRHWKSYAPWSAYFLCPSTDSLYILEETPS
jgi:hypothetical protein